MKESYNSPEGVYRRAKARGMDLVTITDHDNIDGALAIADRPDVIVGCEVTAVFPGDGVAVHLGVLGITEEQHREIQRLRHDIRELLPYLKRERVFTTLAGSDSHTRRGIGRTWVEADRESFIDELHAGRVSVGGRQGNYFTMASDVLRLAAGFYQDRAVLLARAPFNWRRRAFVLGGIVGLPLVAVPLAAAMAHFILEERFNRSLLFDLVKRPAIRLPEAA
jgi:hypothetical protein